MRLILIAAAAFSASTLVQAADTTSDAIATLKAVKDFSEGAAPARTAQSQLVSGGAANLVPVLQGFQGSSPLASNYLRNAFEAIAQNELKAGRTLPDAELLAFIRKTDESPTARRLAYEWLLKQQPELESTLIPQMLTDPSPEFRRDAVAKLIDQATAVDGQEAVSLFQKALSGAVHEDQVKTISKALRDADIKVDIQRHFGFLAEWKLIGPFDNKDTKGFAVAYPPEQKIDLSAEYDGQLGKVAWQPLSSDDDYGLIDIGKQIENYKGSLMYATTTYNSSRDQSVEFRLGTPNAWKLWVNGELVFQREEYHRGTRMDQYRVPVVLKSGPNTILLKVCQNEQTQDWAQRYQFQLRVCDGTGSAVLPATRSASNTTPDRESR
jgi:hypothetical protein